MPTRSTPRHHSPESRPKPEHVIEAVRHLLEGLPVPDRYIVALIDLIEGEYVRRIRTRRRVA